jgi:hypothetical protein
MTDNEYTWTQVIPGSIVLGREEDGKLDSSIVIYKDAERFYGIAEDGKNMYLTQWIAEDDLSRIRNFEIVGKIDYHKIPLTVKRPMIKSIFASFAKSSANWSKFRI